MPENPRGWRRMWPDRLWLQTVEPSPGVWSWKIWTEDKSKVIACAAEEYSRQTDCVRGALRFYQTLPASVK